MKLKQINEILGHVPNSDDIPSLQNDILIAIDNIKKKVKLIIKSDASDEDKCKELSSLWLKLKNLA
jgi:hypothetical protein